MSFSTGRKTLLNPNQYINKKINSQSDNVYVL